MVSSDVEPGYVYDDGGYTRKATSKEDVTLTETRTT